MTFAVAAQSDVLPLDESARGDLPGGDALRLGRRVDRLIGVWTILCLLAPLPLAIKLGRSLWHREQYQFFPLMLVGIVFVGWERWQEVPWRRVRRGSFVVSAIALLLGLAILVAGEMLWLRLAAGIALIVILAGVAWRIGGAILLREMLPMAFLLAIMIPPPGGEDQNITIRLQQLAVRASSRLLDGLRVPHVRAGNVLEIPGRRLLVEQACSGINSLMAVFAFVLLWGVWKRRPAWLIALLLLVAAGFVVLGNAFRITFESWLKVRRHIDILEGTAHQLLGLVIFIGCIALVLSFDVLIRTVISRVLGRDLSDGAVVAYERAKTPPKPVVASSGGGFRTDSSAERSSTSDSLIGWREWSLAGIFVVVGIWSQARVGHAWAPPALGDDAYFDLPATMAGWEKVQREASIVERPQMMAAKSFLWQFRRGDVIASVALDYPFASSHELTICYSLSGWAVERRTVEVGQTQVIMRKPAGLEGCLFFECINERGQWEPPPPLISGVGLKALLEYASRDGQGEVSYQVQTLVQSYSKLSDEQLNATRNLYQAVRETLTAQLKAQLPKGSS